MNKKDTNKGFGANEVFDFMIEVGDKVFSIDTVVENELNYRHGRGYLEIQDSLVNPDLMSAILAGELSDKAVKITCVMPIRGIDQKDRVMLVSIVGASIKNFEFETDDCRDSKIEYLFEFDEKAKVVVV